LPAVVFASWLAAADGSAVAREDAQPRSPSSFDYLVLASLADSPQLHAMAGLRASAGERDESKSAPAQPLKAEDWPH
jgi:hypothetical protein